MSKIVKSGNNLTFIKSEGKAKRLGWVHRSKYEFRPIGEIHTHAKKIHTYSVGPFAGNKLVP